MRMIAAVPAMQRLAREWRRAGTRVGLVPTMGCLHAGHLSLVKRARQLVGSRGKVVLSIYVNPTQFAPGEDFSRYPRSVIRDLKLCRDAGVDVAFAPSDGQMYPGKSSGGYSTYVVEERLSRSMEGASRPAHFRGVTTIVAKLFNIVLPDVAVFGAKDFQQAAIIKRMTCDLNFPLRIVVAPTVRESDGLAMSSRNRYLEGESRVQATVLWRAIEQARTEVGKSQRPISASRLKARIRKWITAEPEARLEYVELFDPETLEPVRHVTRGVRAALAVRIGRTRLIDNAAL